MSLSVTLLLIIFYFLFPIGIIYFAQKVAFLNKIGAVVLAYIFGLILGNSGVFPRASKSFIALLGDKTHLPEQQVMTLLKDGLIDPSDVMANQIASVQDAIFSLVILVAIPLLLFSLDLKKWLKQAGEAMLSLTLAMVSLLIAVISGFFIYKNLIDDAPKISGMLVGLYTGGTPNLAAISAGLGINANIFLLTLTYDMVIGAVCLVFLMTAAQRIFNLFLPSFDKSHKQNISDVAISQSEDPDKFIGMLNRKGITEMMKGLGFSLLIVTVGGGISLLVPTSAQMLTIILTITTLGLLFSNWKIVNRIENTFPLGMYFIIVFSLVFASMGNLAAMFHVEYIHLFSFVLFVVIGSIAIHVMLSYFFKVDSDTTIITITALAFSPPFVPVVAGALKNKEIIISGLTVGILGYAIGNYLGLGMAYFLSFFA